MNERQASHADEDEQEALVLSHMVRQLFENDPLVFYPTCALGIFLVVFAGVVTGVVRRGAAHYDHLARLPLDDREEGR